MASRASRTLRAGRVPAGTGRFETVGDWLRFAVTTLAKSDLTFAQGLQRPQEEALLLVSRFLALDDADLPQFLACRLTPGENRELGALIQRRVHEHVPVPYLINETVQADLRFYVDERVLIPRSYLAGLIPGELIQFGGRNWAPRRILDVGTGSGCLAVIAARAFPEATVDAIDVSHDALAVAAINVASYDLDDRVHLLQSDLFSSLRAARYDLILANPPYEPTALVRELPPEFHHEPTLALDGGHDGMDCVRRIVHEARAHLTPGGILVLELGGLRDLLRTEFPRLRHTVFSLPDQTDAVIGIRARDLPQVPRPRAGRKAAK